MMSYEDSQPKPKMSREDFLIVLFNILAIKRP